MISLVVAVLTYRKQWKFFETLNQVDNVLSRNFSIITPKKIGRTIVVAVVCVTNVILLLLVALTYFVFETLQIPSLMLCVSYYVANLPYAALVLQFCFSSNAIKKRFYYINNVFRQVACNDIPKVFDVCSRNEKNVRHTPTISLQEIYSIYGGYQMRKNVPSRGGGGVNMREEFNKEIRKLTTQLEKREEGIIQQLKRKDLIEVEEFKITKLSSVEATLDHLTKLVDIHDDLLDAISLQNQILSFQILLIVAQIFAFGIIAYFSLYRTLYNTQSDFLAYTNIFWIVLYNIILFIIMHFASDCVNEGKFTGTAVHKVF